MSDQAPTPNDAANAAQNGNQAPESSTTKDNQELPEWAKTELAEARSEAARYRVEKNQAVEQAKADAEAAYTTEKAELEGKLSKSESNLLRLRIAVGANVPADKIETFAERLQGETEDELRSDAEKLKSFFTAPEVQSTSQSAVDNTQGSGNTLPLNGDPLLNALKQKVGIS